MGAFLGVQRIWPLALAVLGVFVILSPSTAQITFEKTYGGSSEDLAYSARQTLDGGYIISGYTKSFGPGGKDLYLIKTDPLGNVQWVGEFWGGFADDGGHCVHQTADGAYIISGGTYSYGAGDCDICLIRTDSLGNVQWYRTWGGLYGDQGLSMDQCMDGGYVIGARLGLAADQADAYLIKTDSLGNTVWDRTYGGSAFDRVNSVQQTPDGGYIAAGGTESYGAGNRDVYLIKTDALGNVLWDTTCGGSALDEGWSVQQTLDGGYIVTGATASFGAGGYDVYLIKTDSLGIVVWETTYGGSGDESGGSVQQTLDGGYVVAGYTASFGAGGWDFYLIKTDSLGSAVWDRTYGGSSLEQGIAGQQTLDGGYIIAGLTASFGAGGWDAYLIKTDENGLTGIEERSTRSVVSRRPFRLLQNCPNPFHQTAQIFYSLPHATRVTLTIYDITGRMVESLVNETQQPGIHQVHWNRQDNPSGMYFYRLSAGEFVETRKMVVVE